MRFIIEIYLTGTDGAENVLHRTSVNKINPAGARKEARQLFDTWKKRNASGVRVMNAYGETVYSWN